MESKKTTISLEDNQYFSDNEETNKEYLFEYYDFKAKNKLKEDLFFFNPSDFKCSATDIYSMNQFMLADYMDLIDTDKNMGENIDKTIDYLIKSSKTFEEIVEYVNNNIDINIKFYSGLEIEQLMENFKSNLMDETIKEMYISSGTIHAIRYSLIFNIINDEDLNKIKDNLSNRDINIIYGPFALLEEKEENQFIKLLFNLKDNRKLNNFSLKRYNKEQYRLHFSYIHKNNNKKYITVETPHREYFLRRNSIELDIPNSNKDFLNKDFLNKDILNNSQNILNYNEFIDKNYSENLKNYFSYCKSSDKYIFFKKDYSKYIKN